MTQELHCILEVTLRTFSFWLLNEHPCCCYPVQKNSYGFSVVLPQSVLAHVLKGAKSSSLACSDELKRR